uniref:Gustatory receptor n=1 Tax=Phlebotomus papatasi TaxID=29031 RepID=A0A240SY93_PHLPP
MEVYQKTNILLDPSGDTFHRAVGITLQGGQIFGLFPVSGILNKNSNKIRFRWISIKVLYYFYIFIFQTIHLMLSLRRVVRVEMSFGVFAAVFFYFVTLIGGFIIFQKAKNWLKIVKRIELTEKIFLHPPYRQVGFSMRRKVRLVTLILLIGGVAEHMMYFSTKFINAKAQLEKCNLQLPVLEHFLKTERRHLFSILPYNTVLALLFEWSNICITICWSYMDVFISLFTCSMAYRFRQITDRMKRARFQTMPDSFWIEIRSHFTDLTNLLNYLDKQLASLIIIACGNNLYFICQQLFNSFEVTSDALNAAYFLVSLMYIICRTLTMLFFAASVNEAAKEPYQMLKALPYTSWSTEIQRFSDQLISEVIGFSGNRFFFITRTLILALIGTIVTYELVLLDHITEPPEIIQNSCYIAYLNAHHEANWTA